MTTSTERLMQQIDGSGSESEREAVRILRIQLGQQFYSSLLDLYRNSSNWKIRASCLYYAIAGARTGHVAKGLALEALSDRSGVVRYRACMLLAASLDKSLLPRLLNSKETIPSKSRGDLAAAIDAIQGQNINWFIDRDHSGKMKLNVDLD